MGNASQLNSAISTSTDEIDRLCDAFEQFWRDGQTPRIEDYLPQVEPSCRRELISELVGIELHWRRQRSETPQLDEYLERFPEFGELLHNEREFSTWRGESADTLAERVAPPRMNELPRRFGSYELLAEIGRGGMGVVYRARQVSADRLVALKVIGRERLAALADDKRREVQERFRTEALASARLHHAHLVTVYEVGEVDEQPFFSMQLIDGPSLAEVLRHGPLPGDLAARYLESVARAVDEAHQHGILHRDLKPQNVLIESRSDRALVVDFGLAKLLEQTEPMTQSGEIVGTPSHMAPEQAINASAVTARTDVYALGATLYHMLAARPPFQAATMVETLRQVAQQDPVSPRRLNPAIPRDLETICLKCLEKDPHRRYDSARKLADDLQRFCARQPIHAQPIGILGRAARFARRSPLAASLAAAASGLLLLTIVSLAVAYRVQTNALQSTRDAQTRSDRSFRDAVETVKRLCTRVSEDTLLHQPGMQPLRRELLLEAQRYFESFLAQRENDPELRRELAAAHFQIGVITEELESPAAALRSFRQAQTLQRALVAEFPHDQELLAALATTSNRLGRAHQRLHVYEQASDAYEDALRLRKLLVQSTPDNVEYQRSLANILMNLGLLEMDRGELETGRERLQQAQTIRLGSLHKHPDHISLQRDVAQGHFNFANLALRSGEAEAASEQLRAAAVLFQALTRQPSPSPEDVYRLALCERLLGDQEAANGQLETAGEIYRRAETLAGRLVDENPGIGTYQLLLAGVRINLAQALDELGHRAETRQQIADAVAILEPLVARHPEQIDARRDLALALDMAGEQHLADGNHELAGSCWNQCRQLLAGLQSEFPDNADFAEQHGKVERALATLTVKVPRATDTPASK